MNRVKNKNNTRTRQYKKENQDSEIRKQTNNKLILYFREAIEIFLYKFYNNQHFTLISIFHLTLGVQDVSFP